MPFTRALFLYGDPIYIARDEDVEKARLRLEHALNTLADQAERDFDTLWEEKGRGMSVPTSLRPPPSSLEP